MKNLLSKVFIFAAGAAVGSVVTWKLIKTKYEQLAEEEIESVKEVYSRRAQRDPYVGDESNEPVETYTDEEKIAYAKLTVDAGYTEKEKEAIQKVSNMPYVISPEDVGDTDYDLVTLIYYDDRTLADEDNIVIDDPEETVGPDALGSFGEYEDDTVYVRDDRLQIEYEILLSDRPFYGE